MDEGHPVEFKPLPPIEIREEVLRERRYYSKQLAESAARIKHLEAEAAANEAEVASSYIDALTGLPNRKLFQQELPELIREAHEENVPLALMILDVQGLKRTNDELGHPAGDSLLKAVAEAVKEIQREGDIAGRFDGDEFWVIKPGYDPVEGQTLDELNHDQLTRLQNKFGGLAAKLGIPDHLHVGISFGVAILEAGETAEEFYARADYDEYVNHGKNYASLEEQGVTFFDPRLDSVGMDRRSD
jgi:diguanylate cyclase (GGDEF)-like protein